ncbi:uncharacterized protein LOC124133583 [Haliotis rufescens]|uniref:uncharacterized protein LOC124133583 n=1 Tax=Haliotis rufescens TaxID=6454 RepID=UPI001EB00903|nr:uncharacterized protein LOC124133583 [Haliotis rufescens]
MKIALILLVLSVVVALPGAESWGIRRIVRDVARTATRVARTVTNTASRVVRTVGRRLVVGKRDITVGDVDDDVDVSDEEILQTLATRDVEDLIENGFISGADNDDFSLHQRQRREDLDHEEE